MAERYNNGRRKIDDNDSTILIPDDSEEYRQSAQAYGRQHYNQQSSEQPAYGQQNYSQPMNYEQQYYSGNTQPYYGQQQYYQQPYQEQPGYPQQPYYGGQYQQPQQNPYPYQPQRPPQQRPPQRKKKKKKRKKNPALRIILRIFFSLLIIFMLIFGIYSCISLSLISKINYKPTGKRSRTPGAMSEKYVESVLIIGTDGRSKDDRGRSDSMILVSLNRKTNQIIMTSFMRDSYVNIPGRGWDKLNAAYSYGGAELLMDTIESNFNVKIDNYMSVNFSSFASIIDAAGGIDLTISDEEAEAINVILVTEVNELMGDEPAADFLTGGGKVHLSGKQALCYSRIRYVGNNDFERTSRQRRVMTELIKKAASSGPSFINKVSKKALPNITSNMTRGQLYRLSLRLPFVLGYDTKQIQIPVEGSYWSENADVGDVLAMNFEMNIDTIRKKVFAD